MPYNAELQMLREFAHFELPDKYCFFCKQPLMQQIQFTFGHRRHTRVKALITLHHFDEDRGNNQRSNLFWAHSACHKRHKHKSQQRGHRHEEEKGERQEEKGEVDASR